MDRIAKEGGGLSKLSWWKTICLMCVFCAVGAIALPAQTFKTLVSFNGSDGSFPSAAVVQGSDGNFYGTTAGGGDTACSSPFSSGCGTVFKMTAGGKLTTLYSFGGADGEYPSAVLLQATNGNFYGTTWIGVGKCAPYGCGTVFEVTPGGTLTTLHGFDTTDGANPRAGLVQAIDGNLYGSTAPAGAGYGTVFKITPRGKLTTLYSFCHETGCTDGKDPEAELVQDTDGNFYGTTWGGGANCAPYGCGTVFKVTPGGTLTTLHRFNSTDGANPGGRWFKPATGPSTGQRSRAGPTAPLTGVARSSRSLPGVRWPRCTASTGLTAPSLSGRWCKLPTETSTGQPRLAGPTTVAPSSRSPQRAH